MKKTQPEEISFKLLTPPNAISAKLIPSGTIEERVLLPTDTNVYKLTEAGIKYYKAVITKKNLFDVVWPTNASIAAGSGNPFAEIDDDKDTATKSLAVLLDDVKNSTSKQKTPGGRNLTASQAGVISRNGAAVVKAGNMNIYYALYYIDRNREQPATHDLAFDWDLDWWRTQVQPTHLLDLVTDIMAVDIRLFADLCTSMSRPEADRLTSKFLCGEDRLIDDTGTDLSLVGGYHDRLRACLLNFCVTLDALFQLVDSIKDALYNAMARVLDFVKGGICRSLGPMHPTQHLLFHYVAYQFQATVALAYGQLRAGHFDVAEEFVIRIADFPDFTQHSVFSQEVNFILMHERLPASIARAHVTQAPPRLGHDTTPKTPPAPSVPNSTDTPTGICGYWHSTKGCKALPGKQCRFGHHDPTTDKEKTFLDKFFKRYKSLTRKA